MLETLSQMPQGRGPQVPVINLYPCQLVAHEAFSSPITQPLMVLVLLGSGSEHGRRVHIVYRTCKVPAYLYLVGFLYQFTDS